MKRGVWLASCLISLLVSGCASIFNPEPSRAAYVVLREAGKRVQISEREYKRLQPKFAEELARQRLGVTSKRQDAKWLAVIDLERGPTPSDQSSSASITSRRTAGT